MISQVNHKTLVSSFAAKRNDEMKYLNVYDNFAILPNRSGKSIYDWNYSCTYCHECVWMVRNER